MRRGDIRTALLAVLSEGPGHGYEVIQTLEAKSDGAWRPSPGSVYPALQLLTDRGMLQVSDRDGKRVYEITAAGRAEAEERLRENGAPWEHIDGGRPEFGDLRGAVRELQLAARQVAVAGKVPQLERAVEIVTRARKDLYQLLAEG